MEIHFIMIVLLIQVDIIVLSECIYMDGRTYHCTIPHKQKTVWFQVQILQCTTFICNINKYLEKSINRYWLAFKLVVEICRDLRTQFIFCLLCLYWGTGSELTLDKPSYLLLPLAAVSLSSGCYSSVSNSLVHVLDVPIFQLFLILFSMS